MTYSILSDTRPIVACLRVPNTFAGSSPSVNPRGMNVSRMELSD